MNGFIVSWIFYIVFTISVTGICLLAHKVLVSLWNDIKEALCKQDDVVNEDSEIGYKENFR